MKNEDNQKQIEELAKDIYKSNIRISDIDYVHGLEGPSNFKKLATILHNIGYHKNT